ncbi:MAG: DUF1178 family protein [Desulfobacterales bacterium]|nr:DUF1178 family protein [Desulfobacterales bacterium]
MIAFDLQCENGHTFEGWFKDHRAYKRQLNKGMIECPVCSTTNVEKILSPVAIKSSKPAAAPVSTAKTFNRQQLEILKAAKKINEYMDKNFDDVGTNFYSEALKIHYGSSEPRNIKGISTGEEEKILKKEGVNFFKVPSLKPADPEKKKDN